MKLMPYLMFQGQCREAFAFYAQVLRGQILSLTTYGDMPPMDGAPPLSEAMKPMVANVQLVSDSAELMGADGAENVDGCATTMVNIDVDSIGEAERIFAGLSADGRVLAPIGETAWAHRWGMFADRYGKPWMVSCMKPLSARGQGGAS